MIDQSSRIVRETAFARVGEFSKTVQEGQVIDSRITDCFVNIVLKTENTIVT